ncbi:MAG: ankyrin repeat domain-containing protein [Deltaproteobacteria bacterium]|nr:ankyrin repeat domain-containing protein [Deltaproteobacteria bacterium]
MPDLLTTCGKCGVQYSWNSDFQDYPNCPRCGYNAVQIARTKRIECSNAAQAGDIEILKRLLKEPDVMKNINAGPWTILHHAVFGNHAEIVRYLLAQGASPDIAYLQVDDETPLHSAAARGRYHIAILLILGGATISAKNVRGKSPVDLAAEANDERMVSLLRKLHDSPEMVDRARKLNAQLHELEKDLDLLQRPLSEWRGQVRWFLKKRLKYFDGNHMLEELVAFEKRVVKLGYIVQTTKKERTALRKPLLFGKKEYEQRVSELNAKIQLHKQKLEEAQKKQIAASAELREQCIRAVQADIQTAELAFEKLGLL